MVRRKTLNYIMSLIIANLGAWFCWLHQLFNQSTRFLDDFLFQRLTSFRHLIFSNWSKKHYSILCHRLSISSARWMYHCQTSVSIGFHMFHTAISLHYSWEKYFPVFFTCGPMNSINHNNGKDLGDDDRVVQLQSELKQMNIHYWNQGFRCVLTLQTILYNGCFTVSLIFLSNCSSSALVKKTLFLFYFWC